MRKKVFTWIKKGCWGVLDQFFFVGAGFLLNILLARWLTIEEYGAFAIGFSVFLLLCIVHSVFLVEPMLVFGSGKYAQIFKKYFFSLARAQLFFSLMIFGFLALTGFVLWQFEKLMLAKVFLGLAVAMPFVLTLWILRRVFYIISDVRWSVLGGIFYIIFMFLGIYLIYQADKLSSLSALIMMGVSACIVGLIFFGFLCRRLGGSEGVLSFGDMLKEHWNFGKWIVAGAGIQWFRENIYYFLLPLFFTIESSAVLRSLTNFNLPLISFHVALSLIFLPTFSRSFFHQGASFLRKDVFLMLAFSLVVSVVYWALICGWGKDLMNIFYQGNYDKYAFFICVVVISPILIGLTNVFNNALRALKRTDIIFKANASTIIVTLTLGVWLCFKFGLIGAVVGMLVSQAAMLLVLVVLYSRAMKALWLSG